MGVSDTDERDFRSDRDVSDENNDPSNNDGNGDYSAESGDKPYQRAGASAFHWEAVVLGGRRDNIRWRGLLGMGFFSSFMLEEMSFRNVRLGVLSSNWQERFGILLS